MGIKAGSYQSLATYLDSCKEWQRLTGCRCKSTRSPPRLRMHYPDRGTTPQTLRQSLLQVLFEGTKYIDECSAPLGHVLAFLVPFAKTTMSESNTLRTWRCRPLDVRQPYAMSTICRPQPTEVVMDRVMKISHRCVLASCSWTLCVKLVETATSRVPV